MASEGSIDRVCFGGDFHLTDKPAAFSEAGEAIQPVKAKAT